MNDYNFKGLFHLSVQGGATIKGKRDKLIENQSHLGKGNGLMAFSGLT